MVRGGACLSGRGREASVNDVQVGQAGCRKRKDNENEHGGHERATSDNCRKRVDKKKRGRGDCVSGRVEIIKEGEGTYV